MNSASPELGCRWRPNVRHEAHPVVHVVRIEEVAPKIVDLVDAVSARAGAVGYNFRRLLAWLAILLSSILAAVTAQKSALITGKI